VHEWIVPGDEEVPMPPDGYIVSCVPFHECGLTVPPTDSFRASAPLWHRAVAPEPQ
jgi:hypothetical protein